MRTEKRSGSVQESSHSRCLLADIYDAQGFEARAECQYQEAEGIDDYETDFVERSRRY